MFPATPFRVLAVDDDVLALNLIERILAPPEAETFASLSPLRGLELAANHSIDLVIADQRMPEMSGLEFLQRFREVRPDAIRILLTAYPDVQVCLQAINEGLLYRFVLKPWNIDDMRITVRRAVEAKRVAEENERLVRELHAQFDELVAAERMAMLGRLSAGIGHELLNAIAPLLAQLTVVQRRLVDLAAQVRMTPAAVTIQRQLERSFGVMARAGEQASAIIHGLKGYSRNSIAPRPSSVNVLVETAIQLLSHRLIGGVRLHRELGQVPEVICRGEEIVQVVVNLLSNAIDEVVEAGRGEVRIRTDATESHVRIHIADTGRGLPERVRENLFTPFVTEKGEAGTGLGLSICKSIVEAHGGSIHVATEPARGTVFSVALPLTPASQDVVTD